MASVSVKNPFFLGVAPINRLLAAYGAVSVYTSTMPDTEMTTIDAKNDKGNAIKQSARNRKRPYFVNNQIIIY